MGKPREFTTLPARAIADQRLSGLELRCLAVISMHDGMSLARGTGAGCFASSATLAALVRTDVTNMSKAISRLVKFGYVVREPQQMDRRRFTLRVVFGDDDSWRNDQLFPPADRTAKVGELTNDAGEKVGETTNEPAEIVGGGQSENGGISSETGSYYISLNEELHSDKTEEINSVETAHRENATRVGEIDQVGEVVPFQRKKDRAEAPLASEVSIAASLTRAFSNLQPAAKLVRFEEELARIGRRFDLLPSREQRHWIDWLLELTDSQAGDPAGHHALRLWEEVEFFEEQAAR